MDTDLVKTLCNPHNPSSTFRHYCTSLCVIGLILLESSKRLNEGRSARMDNPLSTTGMQFRDINVARIVNRELQVCLFSDRLVYIVSLR